MADLNSNCALLKSLKDPTEADMIDMLRKAKESKKLVASDPNLVLFIGGFPSQTQEGKDCWCFPDPD